jgi:hypothetical protein
MAEWMTFQSPFSLKIWVGERESVLSKKNHCDVFSKTSRCFFQIITMSFPNHWEDFFISLGRLFCTIMKKKKNIIVSSGKHYSVLEKAL